MASQNPADLLASSFEKIKQAINVNIVMGEPLDTGLGMTVIPVSKVTYGFTSGGTKSSSHKADEESASGGFTMEPVAFLIVQDGDVTVKQIGQPDSSGSKAMDLVPGMFDKVTGFVKK